MKVLSRFSVGTGDRFGREGIAQIEAFRMLAEKGVDASIVWNKSNREHIIIGTGPADQRKSADKAIAATGFKGMYAVDADHIGLATVDRFLPYCDFFTIDVADFIGKPTEPEKMEAFAAKQRRLCGDTRCPVSIAEADIAAGSRKYLYAIEEAAKVYRRILAGKPDGNFHIEVSLDETDVPQSPAELALILAGLADEGVPVQTIAPKFSGRFNKGVDYVGDTAAFAREFEQDVRVTQWAAQALGLPASLKLSVHSGSDKFSIYPAIRRTIQKTGCGLHLKTAGTTWLEELVGLAEAGGEGLEMAKLIYRRAYARYEELAAPYAAVIDIAMSRLPVPKIVDGWSSEAYTAALRHVPSNKAFNPDFRQLLHVGYKVAAELGQDYLNALEAHRASISRNVTENLYARHLCALFLD